jgi:hypothetical protein
MLPKGEGGHDESETGACELEGGNESSEAECRACAAVGRCIYSACPRAEVIERPTIPKHGSPAAETFTREGITATSPTETCGHERIAVFHFLRVLWLIVIVIRARQASPGCASGSAAIACRQQVVVVEFPL